MPDPKRKKKYSKDGNDYLITLLSKELQVPNQGTPNAQLIVKELVKRAREGDTRIGMWIFDRICGKPKNQKTDSGKKITDLNFGEDDYNLEEFESFLTDEDFSEDEEPQVIPEQDFDPLKTIDILKHDEVIEIEDE